VPVIGIFTKLDGRELEVMDAVCPNPSPSDFIHPPPEVEQKAAEFIDGLETQIWKQQYPPAAFIRVKSKFILSEH
jgi:hypothetical protein